MDRHTIKSNDNLEIMMNDYNQFYNTIADERFIINGNVKRKVYDLKENYGRGVIEYYNLSNSLIITIYDYELIRNIESNYELTKNYFELEYCLEGSMVIEMDDRKEVFNENKLSISLNNEMSGRIIRSKNNRYCGVSIVGNKKYIEEFMSKESYDQWDQTMNSIDKQRRYKQYFGVDTSREIATAFRQIAECNIPESVRPLYLESKIMEILAMIISEEIIKREEYSKTDLTIYEIDQIKKIPKTLMDYRFALPSLKSLSEMMGLSEKKMNYGFRYLFNDTIMAYHRKNVLRIGADMLLRGNDSVNEITEYLAYASASSFIYAFKQEYGITPHKYRETSIHNRK